MVSLLIDLSGDTASFGFCDKFTITFGLDKLHESGSVDDAVQTMVRCSTTKLDRYGNFYDVLQQGITLEKFDEMKKLNAGKLKTDEIKMMKAIRKSIPNPDSETWLRKTIPIDSVNEYLKPDGYNTIQGYVTNDSDVSHIKGYKNVRESLRLDYIDKDGKMPYPEDGNAYGYIKFRTGDTGKLKIAFGKEMGGTNMDGEPCTRTAFLGSGNDEITPEWKLKNLDEDGEDLSGMKPEPGAEIHEVIDGRDYIVGYFRGDSFEKEEIPILVN